MSKLIQIAIGLDGRMFGLDSDGNIWVLEYSPSTRTSDWRLWNEGLNTQE